MNKEKLLVLMDKAEISENSNFRFDQLERFKNALLDDLIKEIQKFKLEINHELDTYIKGYGRGVNRTIGNFIKTIEDMK